MPFSSWFASECGVCYASCRAVRVSAEHMISSGRLIIVAMTEKCVTVFS